MTPFPIVRDCTVVQAKKAPLSIDVTESGISIVCSLVQYEIEPGPIVFTPLGTV